jgi:hypothetical protein
MSSLHYNSTAGVRQNFPSAPVCLCHIDWPDVENLFVDCLLTVKDGWYQHETGHLAMRSAARRDNCLCHNAGFHTVARETAEIADCDSKRCTREARCRDFDDYRARKPLGRPRADRDHPT